MRLTCLLLVLAAPCFAQNSRRLNYLDENNPYYPGLKFPKLITPQWVGEEGVDAVIILGIDDMRDTAKYEQYLRPILTRLKKIDGRAPVSIMTNKVKPDDPQLQSWLDEGLSLECHTIDHPCPLLKDGDFDKAKSTYDRCVDLMGSIPRNKPVAFRMPCCDSLNTVSPRFFSEIFNKTTEKNNYLTIDTSVFNFFTSDDPDIPRDLIVDADGQDKFLKYMPKDRGFVNYIENYPYPYVINKLCWEFPCVAPSDWSAQHKHGVNNQVTVDDWKAAIDITVVKKGVFCLVFHPYGWIKSEQIVELIDHAQAKHGKKVKFLTFKEAARRLEENFLRGRKMRPAKSQYMRFQIDEDSDYVGITLPGTKESKGLVVWVWRDGSFGDPVGWRKPLLGGSGAGNPYYSPDDQRKAEQKPEVVDMFMIDVSEERWAETTDFPGDVQVVGGDILKFPPSVAKRIREIAKADARTKQLESEDSFLRDHFAGLRVVDIDKDGSRDLIYSDEIRFGVFLFDEANKGWTKTIVDKRRGAKPAAGDLPPIANADFSDNGFFIHGDAMYWMNEDTAKEPHLVIRRTFQEVVRRLKKQVAKPKVGRAPPTNPKPVASAPVSGKALAAGGSTEKSNTAPMPGASARPLTGNGNQTEKQPAMGSAHPTGKSPQASLSSIKVREGFKVELVAAEPLIHDPIAFDWLPDGRMIVVEMGGYPNGVDDKKTSQRSRLRPSVGQSQQPQQAKRKYANGVTQQSPASRSVRWVTNAKEPLYPNGVPQRESTMGVEPLRGTARFRDDPPGVRFATPGSVVERRWRSGFSTPDVSAQSGTANAHVSEPCCGKVAEPSEPKALASGLGANAFSKTKTHPRQTATRRTWGLRAPSTSDAPNPLAPAINGDSRSPLASNLHQPTLGLGGPKYVLTHASLQPPTQPESTNGRVRILEDTDNDGVYDKATTFLDGLNFPTGVMPWRNGVLISAAPDIIYAEDTNGDGKANKREVLFTGFTEGNQQHRVNGFEYGLDNWVYIANGDSGGTIKSIETGKTLDIRSNDIRIKPDTGEMERVTGRTQYGRHRDAYGNWFGCNNSNPMWHYVLDEKYISRNKHFAPGSLKHVVPEVPGNAPIFPISTTPERFNDFHTANRFTSACSTIVYDDDLFGPHFKRNAFICEPVHNLISRLVLEPNGVTFTGKRAVDEQDREFLASTDNWFRPVFVRTGPDGALWIADMYRHVIEHPEWIPDDWQKKLDLRAGHDKGRIYRVVPVTAKPMSKLTNFPIKGEAKELDNPNRWVRDTVLRDPLPRQFAPGDEIAFSEAYEKQWKSIATLLKAESPGVRIQAIALAEKLAALLQDRAGRWDRAEFVLTALNDAAPSVRRHAIRLSRLFPDNSEVAERLCELAEDPSPQEALELAYTLSESSAPRAGYALTMLFVQRPNDPYLVDAILSGTNEKNISRLLRAGMTMSGSSRQMIERLFGMVGSFNSNEAKVAAEQAIAAFVRQKNEPGFRRALWAMTTLAKSGGETDGTDDETEEQLSRVRVAAWKAAGGKSRTDEEFVADAIRYVSAATKDRWQDMEPIAAHWWNRSPKLSAVTIDEVGRYGGAERGKFLATLFYGQLFPSTRRQILDQLTSRREWAGHLAQLLGNQAIRAAELSVEQRDRLLENPNQSVRARLSKLLKTSDTNRTQVIERFTGLEPGNAIAGRAVFEKRCATCHQVGGVGKQIGADLASLKDKSTKALLAAILDPNRAVETKFVSYTALTEEGKTFSGMIKSESGNAITLIGSDGKEQTVLRSDIEEFSCSNKSLMPEGLEKDLTKQDLANVIAFVRSGTGANKPKSFAGNTPGIVRPEQLTQALRLTARNCQIFGPNLVYESHFGNLGHWASPDDYALWQIEGLKAGRYRVLATTAVPENLANQKFRVEIGSARVQGNVPSSNGWNYYKQFEVGTVEVADGVSTVRVQASGEINQYLMDLRELLLEPVR